MSEPIRSRAHETATARVRLIPLWFFRVLPPPLYHRLRRAPVIGAVLRWLVDLAIPRRGLFLTRMRDGPLAGMVLEVDPRMQIDAVVGRYETAAQRIVEAALDPGHVAFDIGAHLGYFTLLMASRVGEQGRVVAFEPDPTVMRGLHANVKRNGAKSMAEIILVPAAVNGSSGRAAFVEGRETSRGRLTLEGGDFEVEVMTLDDVADRFGYPQLVKIDVEGRELGVLSGARRIAEAAATVFIIEAHTRALEAKCREFLGAHGYVSEVLAEPGRAETYVVARPDRGGGR
jgi:FkbM family methyltransferase